MIRDRLVVGILDTAMSEKLQLDSALDLEKAMKQIRQREAVKEHQSHLRGDGSKSHPVVVDELRRNLRRGARKPHQQGRSSNKPGGAKPGVNERLCKRCGGKDHPRGGNCPAKDATCHRCNRKGHYSAQCFSKTAASVSTGDPEDSTVDTLFLDAVTSKNDSAEWRTTVRLEGQEIPFKMDTGAEVSVITEEVYKSLGRKAPLLYKASRRLQGPTGFSLKTLGEFKGTMEKAAKKCQLPIFVVRGLRTNLLGLPAISALQLAARLDAVNATRGWDPKTSHPNLFKGLGTLGTEYTIKVKNDATPYALYTPRNVPIPLRAKVKEELDRMEKLGVISKVTEPSSWCAGMVVVPKPSGAVRVCVDLKNLNQSVLREPHPIPSVDDTLAHLTGATVFSKVDANSGFWQIPLSEETRHYTTFITPYGRYQFNKLPFGISSAPELFQSRMNRLLEGLDGVLCHMDDVLIFASSEAEHATRLKLVLERLQNAGVTLNREKCTFFTDQIKFLGHIISKSGIRADPAKTEPILKMPPPTNVPELRRFMGMVNHLGKFSPQLATLTHPLRELLSKKNSWTWGKEQDDAFNKVKAELANTPTLTLYDPTAETKVSADASSYGLGAVLLQKIADAWKPVAYASRSLSETERRYAQIEKEALAATWACEKFQNLILGKLVEIESDHKPLIPLLNSKRLEDLPPRVLRFRLRLSRFEYYVKHVSGKLLYTADTLSRAPLHTVDHNLEEKAELFALSTVQGLPASPQRLQKYKTAQEEDPVCCQIANFCQSEWPDKEQLNPSLLPYWKERSSISRKDKLLLYNQRILVPQSLRSETLQKIHTGHQGTARCRLLTKISVWWPGISSEIAQMVDNCSICAKEASHRREPLISTPTPDYPWQLLGSDLFELQGNHYLLVADYYSRYLEVIKLSSTTSSAVIQAMQAMFARFGIPEYLRSDNGPQYSSEEFKNFTNQFGFLHNTSSPRYPQSNGFAERMVQTAKKLIRRSPNHQLALLSYRSTPLSWCNLSPAQLLMGRSLRSTVPQSDHHLIPTWDYLSNFRKTEAKYRKEQKRNYDNRYKTRELPTLPNDTQVWIRSGERTEKGQVVAKEETPRSYVIQTHEGSQLRRNRSHLQEVPLKENTPTITPPPSPLSEKRIIMTRSKTGTEIKLPLRYST